ncbi:hypothetical protein [Geodermatophilus sp. URMC 63]
MTFHRQNRRLRRDAYDVARNLLLTKNGSRKESAHARRTLREDLLGQVVLDDTTRVEVSEDFKRAALEAQKPNAPQDEVVRWLDRVQARLTSPGGTTGAIVGLGEDRVAAYYIDRQSPMTHKLPVPR